MDFTFTEKGPLGMILEPVANDLGAYVKSLAPGGAAERLRVPVGSIISHVVAGASKQEFRDVSGNLCQSIISWLGQNRPVTLKLFLPSAVDEIVDSLEELAALSALKKGSPDAHQEYTRKLGIFLASTSNASLARDAHAKFLLKRHEEFAAELSSTKGDAMLTCLDHLQMKNDEVNVSLSLWLGKFFSNGTVFSAGAGDVDRKASWQSYSPSLSERVAAHFNGRFTDNLVLGGSIFRRGADDLFVGNVMSGQMDSIVDALMNQEKLLRDQGRAGSDHVVSRLLKFFARRSLAGGMSIWESRIKEVLLDSLEVKAMVKSNNEGWMVQTVPFYLTKVSEELSLVDARASFYPKGFSSELRERLRAAFLMKETSRHFVTDGLEGMLREAVAALSDDRVSGDGAAGAPVPACSNLKTLYDLYNKEECVKDNLGRVTEKKTNWLEPIADSFRAYIIKSGKELVNERAPVVNAGGAAEDGGASASAPAESDNLPQFVEKLLRFHDSCSHFNSTVFGGRYDGFMRAFSGAFDVVANFKPDRSNLENTELVAKFVDSVLRGELKLDDSKIERTLDATCEFFKHFHEKDVFIKEYTIHLADRLLSEKSSNLDNEKSMVAKLKTIVGFSPVAKALGMFADFAGLGQLEADYKRHVAAQPTPMGVDFSARVLTLPNWPSPTFKDPKAKVVPEVVLPTELVAMQDFYESWYVKQFTGEKLTWRSDLGSVTIDAQYPSRKYTFLVVPLQAAVLMLFNVGGARSFTEICHRLGLTQELAKPVMNSLSVRFKILSKTGNEKKIKPDDMFDFNSAFKSSSNKLLIKLPSNAVPLTSEEKKEKKEDERVPQLEAAIVRISKARHSVSYNDLYNLIVEQCRIIFVPTALQIKKRIDDLIERVSPAEDTESLSSLSAPSYAVLLTLLSDRDISRATLVIAPSSRTFRRLSMRVCSPPPRRSTWDPTSYIFIYLFIPPPRSPIRSQIN
jgi:hypothetical protein